MSITTTATSTKDAICYAGDIRIWDLYCRPDENKTTNSENKLCDNLYISISSETKYIAGNINEYLLYSQTGIKFYNNRVTVKM